MQPIRKTKPSLMQTELFVFGSWSYADESGIRTANNSGYLYGSFYSAGINAGFFDTKLPVLQYNAAVGYMYQNYFYKGRNIANAGIDSHWLTAELNASYWLWMTGLCAGLKSDIMLSSTIRNNDHFTHEGLYADCFNKASLCLYAGVVIRLSSFKIEARYGGYLIPHFNPERVSYYNLVKATSASYYLEIRASYRIFTTGQVYRN